MEIVQAEVPDEEANEVLRRVHSAVQNMQQSSGVMDTNEQVHAQLDSGEVAILSGSGDSTAGWCKFSLKEIASAKKELLKFYCMWAFLL